MKKVALGAALLATTLLPLTIAETASAAPGSVVRAAAGPTVRIGSHGKAVKELQSRLRALRYDPGKADGTYDSSTRTAVWAFQKVNKIARTQTGSFGTRSWKAIKNPRTPVSIVPRGKRKANRVEVSVSKQLAFVYKGGRLVLTTHISTGSERHEDGGFSYTPRGNFRVKWKLKGWHRAPLGSLYNTMNFYKGYALHGSGNVPLFPDSHGCTRLPMNVADTMFKIVKVGWQVYVKS
ncbi:MAG: L,D-transpeptidase family protein [Streptosporangiaceae bacterium]